MNQMIDEVIETIDSSHELSPPFNFNFKVTAGPGAGKTYWLANNIKNIIRHGSIFRENSISKIACITYTNTGTEELKIRLGDFSDKCEISTIHSFFYKNLVKPYAYLVKDENDNSEINHKEVNGHDEHYSSYTKRKEWLNIFDVKSFQLNNFLKDENLTKGLTELKWKLQENILVLQPKYINETNITRFNRISYFPTTQLTPAIFKEYKKLYWNEGILDHEDVLYFSYRILHENLNLRKFISLKFPYIFLDEFQDTNPIQTQIIKWLAESGSIIGVIGDSAQSIFSFQGAERQDFIGFDLPNTKYFKIEKNRRSTQSIIDLLNVIRCESDFIQEPFESIKGENICLLVSSNNSDLIELHKTKLGEIFCIKPKSVILSRTNSKVTELKQIFSGKEPKSTVWNNFQSVDSDRCHFMNRIIKAQELAQDYHFEMAINEILKILIAKKIRAPLKDFNFKEDKIKLRGIAVKILSALINNRNYNNESTITQFYNVFLLNLFKNCNLEISKIMINAIKKQETKDFLENTTTFDLVSNIKLTEDKNHITTIHKAKGAEFENVFLCLESEKELEQYILNPNINDEECRLRYVALSRARKYLCIYIPALSENNKEKIVSMGINLL